jgi:predicted small lipoprotein YifL
MNKSTVILFFPCLLLAGCGVKGPLTLPPNPNDSYLPRIEKAINEMTGQTTASQTPPAESELEIRTSAEESAPAAEQKTTEKAP